MKIDIEKELMGAEFKEKVLHEDARRCEMRGDNEGYTACLASKASWSAYVAKLKTKMLDNNEGES